MTFSHILFPTDGSENSLKALNYVKEIAEKFQAKVTVINTFGLPVMFKSEIYLKMVLLIQTIKYQITLSL